MKPERATPAVETIDTRSALRLRDVLDEYGVQIAEVAAALSVTQTVQTQRAESVSRSTFSQIVNGDIWPQRVRKHMSAIREQVERYLREERGVPATALERCWERQPPRDKRKTPRSGNSMGVRRKHNQFIGSLGEPVMLSQQARRHFSLPKDPFTDDVNSAEDVFVSADQRYVREVMWQAARHGGFVAVVGESGAGKSVLRRELVDRVQREGTKLVLISPQVPDKTRLNAAMICDAILGDLGAKGRGTLESKARAVTAVLTASLRSGNSHVLLIEEAHDISIQTLKYLKRFWELEDGFRRLLGIVLIGQLELKTKLDERQHYDAREVIRRIEIAELRPLDHELEAYVTHKFARIGVDAKTVFAEDAYDEIRSRLTQRGKGFGGTSVSFVYPLIVGNLARKAMNLAAELGAPRVSAEQIREV